MRAPVAVLVGLGAVSSVSDRVFWFTCELHLSQRSMGETVVFGLARVRCVCNKFTLT